MAASQHLAPSISLTVSPSSNLASSAAKRPKISKRQNARLQLAAALIEADNETLEAKAQAHLDAAAATIYDGLDEPMPAPAPPPEPKLASESVMFAPFRSNPDDYDAQSVARQPSRTRSIQRPQSRDFLGVNLPGQDRYQDGASVGAAASLHTTHSRNVSLSSRNLGDDGDRLSLQHPASRPGSALSLTTSRPASSLRGGGLDRPTSVFSQLSQPGDGLVDDQPAAAAVPEDGLGDWGLDKFLTNEARQRITAARERDSERKRAISMVEVTPPVDDSPPRRPPTTRSRKGSAASSVAIARPWSPAAGAGGSSSSQRRPMSLFETAPQQRQRAKSDVMTTRAPASRSPDLDLLARIKLYRERQENLPPSQWGETPREDAKASKPAVAKEEDAPAAKDVEDAEKPDEAAVEKSDVPFPAGAAAEDAKPKDIGRPTTSDAPTRADETATTPDTSGAIESMASDAASLRREGRVSWHQVSPTTPVDIVRRESVKGYTGESWSEQGSEVSHATGTPATSRSISMSKPSSLVAEHLESTAEEQDDARMTDAPIEAADNEDALTARRLSMAGIGSMAHSRGGSADTAYASTVQQGRHRSFAPSPLGGGWAGTASRPVSPAFMPASLPSSAHLDTVAALHGDYFSALALGPSPYSVIDNVARAGQASPPPVHRAGDGPRSSHMSPRIGGGSLPGTPGSPEQQQQHAQLLSPRMPTSGAALSTRQLQELARHSAFPESYGISSPFALTELEEQEQRIQEAQDAAAAGQYGWQELEPVESLPSDGWVPERQEGLLSKAFRPMTGLFMSSSASSAAVVEKLKMDVARMEPDLSSSKWGRKKKTKAAVAAAVPTEQPVEPIDPMATGYEPRIDDSLSRQTMDAVSDNRVPFDNLADVEENDADDDDGVDDDYISPPSKGKLRPHGVEYWLPEVLVMPGLLEGSPEQPRTKLSEPEEDEYGRAAKQHRRRQSGLYVPEGFVLHDAKGAAVSHITDEGESRPRRTAFIYPVAAPHGIGRRALMSSTALFRNQLVQRDDDREGWGWESTSAPAVPNEGPTPADEGEQAKLSKREKRKAEKTASKEAKARLKRKRARAVRRRARRRAQREGKTYAEVGVAEESPVEDLSLTEDSEGDLSASEGEGSEYDSDDEPRWVDDAKPAGKLFGKSLMDVAEERRAQRLANRRFYGQQEIDAGGRDSNDLAVVPEGSTKDSLSASPYHSNEHTAAPSIMAPSIAGARSFRDNTGGGYNDTRERMQAAFGVDANWAREMAKRRDEEREEEEQRRAEEEVRARIEEEKRARKEARKAKKGIFARQRKAKGQPSAQGEVAGAEAQEHVNGSMMPTAQSYGDFIEAAEEQPVAMAAPASPPRPKTPLEPPRLDVPVGSSTNGHQSTASGFGVAQWLLPDSDSDESSASDDDQRLASHDQQPQQARRQIAPRIELGRLADESSDSEDDEVPLAQLKRKSVMTLAPMLLSPRPSNVGRGRDSSDEDEDEHMTLAQLKRKSQGAASVLMSGSSPRNPAAAAAAASIRPATTSSSSLGRKDAVAASSSSDDDEVPLAQLRTNKSSGPRGSSIKDAPLPPSGSASDEDRPLGLRQGASQAVAAALATLQAKQHQPDGEEEDEDDVPLGSTHPQAAIIARQAAQIRQLQQQEEARQRMSSMMGMGMMGMPQMGTPMMPQWAPPQMMGGGGGDMMGMGMPGMPPSSTMMMSMPQFAAAPTAPSMMFSPGMMQQPMQPPQPHYAQEDVAALMSPPLSGVQTPAQAVKASSIERWRDDVR